jgi:hypothetical protein
MITKVKFIKTPRIFKEYEKMETNKSTFTMNSIIQKRENARLD